MVNRIFLGGTCNNSTWRDDIISKLNAGIQYFNPIVKDWTPECQAKEMDEKDNKCNVHLYVITHEMIGTFSIAEAIDSCHNRRVRTILHIMPQGFETGPLKSLQAVVDLVNLRGGIAYIDAELARTVRVLNYAFG